MSIYNNTKLQSCLEEISIWTKVISSIKCKRCACPWLSSLFGKSTCTRGINKPRRKINNTALTTSNNYQQVIIRKHGQSTRNNPIEPLTLRKATGIENKLATAWQPTTNGFDNQPQSTTGFGSAKEAVHRDKEERIRIDKNRPWSRSLIYTIL